MDCPRAPKPNPSPFSMTKINVTNSIIFITDSIAMSHNDDVKDDVAADMAMTCKFTWSMTWLLTWNGCHMNDDIAAS